ncbi:MAG: AGE family epimerase/isomerase, partial [Candidatus Methylumidiphilus sp.]
QADRLPQGRETQALLKPLYEALMAAVQKANDSLGTEDLSVYELLDQDSERKNGDIEQAFLALERYERPLEAIKSWALEPETYEGFVDSYVSQSEYRLEPRPLKERVKKHQKGVLDALAHLYDATQDVRYRDAALETWRVLRTRMRDPLGGFLISSPRNFDAVKQARRQNPVMHLFEAMLALAVATGNQEALAGTDSLGNFVIYKLLQGKEDGSAYIEEWYDENWLPAPDETGGYIDLGHQFEWAFLLSKAGTQGLGEMYPLVAQRILDYALKVGYDEALGGSFNRAHGQGKVDQDKGFWQQAECLRVLMHFLIVRKQYGLKPRYEQTLAYVQNEWIDNVNGGWFMKPKSICTESGCPDEQPDGYHMTSMHSEGIELANFQSNANR